MSQIQSTPFEQHMSQLVPTERDIAKKNAMPYVEMLRQAANLPIGSNRDHAIERVIKKMDEIEDPEVFLLVRKAAFTLSQSLDEEVSSRLAMNEALSKFPQHQW